MENTSNFCREGAWKVISYGVQKEDKSWSVITSEDNNLYLTLKNMNLTLLRGSTLLESFSFISNEIQRIVSCKETIAIAIKKERFEVRYIRIRFAGTIFFSGEAVCSQCINVLNHYVTVNRNSGDTDDCVERRQNFTTSVSKYVSELLNQKSQLGSGYKQLNTIYPTEQIVDDCILDTDFPQFVHEVADILSSKQKND